MATADLTAQRLRELLHYDPDTGLFHWNAARGGRYAGRAAGNRRGDGYFDIRVDGVLHRAHRLAWLYMTGEWPANLIDHKNRNPGDTRWENLREATHSQNHQNQVARRDNLLGLKGVSLHERGLFRVRICINGKRIHVGYARSAEGASRMRREAELRHFTHSPSCGPQSESL